MLLGRRFVSYWNAYFELSSRFLVGSHHLERLGNEDLLMTKLPIVWSKQDMNVLISGASTGIGRAAAVHLAMKGHTVWAGVRSSSSFEDLKRAKIRNLEPVFLDVRDPKSVADALGLIQKESGTLHGLVNNAGIAVAGPVEALSLEDWELQFDTNFFGLIRLTQACLPLIRESKGRVVNISSISGKMASPFLGPYASSKYAVEALSDSLRRELKPFGVKVSVIEPGPIATPIWEKSLESGTRRKAQMDQAILPLYEGRLNRLLASTEEYSRKADPVALVTQAIEHALLSRSPKTRYPVGRGIFAASMMARLLPDRWLDYLISKKA